MHEFSAGFKQKIEFYLPCFSHLLSGMMNNKWTIIIGILSAVTLLSMCTLAIILLRRNRARKASEENPKAVSKTLSAHKSFSVQNKYRERMEGETNSIYVLKCINLDRERESS